MMTVKQINNRKRKEKEYKAMDEALDVGDDGVK